MTTDELFMTRCLDLAELGTGTVSPNPMVGSVITHNGKIIGEGFHQKKGEPHAEVFAIGAVKNKDLLKESCLYVNLEPCAHFGATPPCSDLIVEMQIPEVVIGGIDSYSEVAGKGIEKLRKAGIEVRVGILEKECRELNRRFFTFHEQKRPYIILKWAQTMDGFMDIDRNSDIIGQPTWITGDLALRFVHKIRSEEDAILVGRKTALKDNPSLTVRHWSGKNPLRLVTDRKLRLPATLNLFNNKIKTVVFNSDRNEESGMISYVKLDYQHNIIPQILSELHKNQILSVIVEGGRQLIDGFINSNLWDETHVFVGNKFFYTGVKAPAVPGKIYWSEVLDEDQFFVFRKQV